MPTYGYQCTGCSDAFEVVQKITDNALTKCEKCGGELRKKIFPVGIAFKGSGFYVNDYSSVANSSKETATDTAKSLASEATSQEAKPAAPAPESKLAEPAMPSPS